MTKQSKPKIPLSTYVEILRSGCFYDQGCLIGYSENCHDWDDQEEEKFYIVECFSDSGDQEILRFSFEELEISNDQDWVFI